MTRVAIALLVFAGAARVDAAVLFDPALRFRMLPTEHFVIYFHQREERQAAHLAAIAEDAWRRLQQGFAVAPPPRTHVVLVDQTDLANGYATPLPYDTIVVMSTWPAGSEFIGDIDDWLRLAFTHEFTHIVHLDRSEGWARVVRRLFGRVLVAFPNTLLPMWQIEGLATYEESVVTGSGRLHAGDFGAIVREEARAGRMQPLDRLNGGLTDWPDGLGAYGYGLGFHQYLADRFGAASLARLADATASRIPYTGSRAFHDVYGESLGTLWREYQSSLAESVGPPAAPDAGVTRLTHHGFSVSGPRFDRFACASCPPQIVYSVRTPDGFPTLDRVGLDGTKAGPIATRYFGDTTAIGEDAIYFDQIEIRRNAGAYNDLYRWSRRDGRVTKLTNEARLEQPDLSPDGATLVCVQEHAGQRDLVLVRLKPDTTAASGVVSGAPTIPRTSIDTLIAEADTQFNAPRWSPDGRTIAVERHRPGARSEIVLVDVASKRVSTLTSEPAARVVTPAWRPDGRAIVAAMAAEDEPFNLYEFARDSTAPPRQLTHTTGGATWPDVSPDGRTIVFVGYTVDGFDLFTTPYTIRDAASERDVPRRTAAGAKTDGPSDAAAGAAANSMTAAPYSPLPTLRPTSWSPVIESDATQTRIGASVAGGDVLGYHLYAATATWLASSPPGAETLDRTAPDWQLAYAYDRWRPTLWIAAKSSTDFFAAPADDSGLAQPGVVREREAEAGAIVPFRHARIAHVGRVSLLRGVDDFTLPARPFSVDRTALRAAWATSTAHFYGYSISPEGGVTVGGTAETIRHAWGSSGDADAITGDARVYAPGLRMHDVIALRVGGGAATGDRTLRRTFLLGGSSADAGVVDFGAGAFGLLRGFPSNTFAGSRVALVNAEYRAPLWRPERGAGTWPLFLHTVHAALFADAGHAWTTRFDARALKTSVGAELSANIVAGYFFPFTVAAGAARGHDGGGLVGDRTTLYIRVGRSF